MLSVGKHSVQYNSCIASYWFPILLCRERSTTHCKNVTQMIRLQYTWWRCVVGITAHKNCDFHAGTFTLRHIHFASLRHSSSNCPEPTFCFLSPKFHAILADFRYASQDWRDKQSQAASLQIQSGQCQLHCLAGQDRSSLDRSGKERVLFSHADQCSSRGYTGWKVGGNHIAGCSDYVWRRLVNGFCRRSSHRCSRTGYRDFFVFSFE